MGTLSADLDEMSSEAAMSEEKAQRAMIDAARYSCHRPIRLNGVCADQSNPRLADELRAEQDCAQGLERERKLLEAQVKDIHPVHLVRLVPLIHLVHLFTLSTLCR